MGQSFRSSSPNLSRSRQICRHVYHSPKACLRPTIVVTNPPPGPNSLAIQPTIESTRHTNLPTNPTHSSHQPPLPAEDPLSWPLYRTLLFADSFIYLTLVFSSLPQRPSFHPLQTLACLTNLSTCPSTWPEVVSPQTPDSPYTTLQGTMHCNLLPMRDHYRAYEACLPLRVPLSLKHACLLHLPFCPNQAKRPRCTQIGLKCNRPSLLILTSVAGLLTSRLDKYVLHLPNTAVAFKLPLGVTFYFHTSRMQTASIDFSKNDRSPLEEMPPTLHVLMPLPGLAFHE
ncbi:unnamed protein product [Protopolystoma xenopodis]|uniref:Uncharacterized protein n=1 Tax=Protopolystoma xenopodis TaxID=117903 RepID=A0A3S5BDM0_9PLAT|nr:unnamed protein product [Protopolystoma xenopodis]